MRPRGYYVVFLWPDRPAIAHGYDKARALSPGRCYVRHDHRHQAEEFLAWWEYKHPTGTTPNTTG